MNNFCYLNGAVIPLVEAKVSVQDIGILRGFGIYEGIAAINGKPFRFTDHFERFVKSAQALALNIPITEEKCEKVIKDLLEKNNKSNGRANIRMILTGGEAANGIEYSFETPTFYILIENHNPIAEGIYENGGKLMTYHHKRDLPEIKTTNYIRAVNLQQFRKEEGAIEILYTFEGDVLECSTSNVFIVKDKKVITPSENILMGITRKVVLEIAGGKYEIEERVVEVSELMSADEVFITSSFKDIVPITKIDDFEVGSGEAKGKVGPATRDLTVEFAKTINLG